MLIYPYCLPFTILWDLLFISIGAKDERLKDELSDINPKTDR